MKELQQDFILVKKEEIKKETDSGLLKAGSVKEKQSVAIVIEISPEVNKIREEKELCLLEKGHRVLCGDHSIREVKIDDKKYNFIRHKDLIAIIS